MKYDILAGLRSLDSVNGTNRYVQLMEKLSVGSSDFMEGGQSVLIDLSSWYENALAFKFEMIRNAIEEKREIKEFIERMGKMRSVVERDGRERYEVKRMETDEVRMVGRIFAGQEKCYEGFAKGLELGAIPHWGQDVCRSVPGDGG